MNGSNNALENAGIRIFFLVVSFRYFDIFPMQIVVLVLIPGSSSTCSFAKLDNSSLLMIFSDNLGASCNTDFTVASLTGGYPSLKPLARLGNIL